MHFVDPDVIPLLKNGNRIAFKKVYDSLSNGVYSVSVNLVKDKTLAEEVVQEVFVKLWVHRDRLTEGSNLWLFLYVVSKRLSLNKLRSISRERVSQEKIIHLSDVQRSPEEDVFYKELELLVNRTVQDLPEKQRIIIEMSRNEGLTHAQIAEKLGISPNTVKNHMTQALKQLRDKLRTSNLDVYLPFLLSSEFFFKNN